GRPASSGGSGSRSPTPRPERAPSWHAQKNSAQSRGRLGAIAPFSATSAKNLAAVDGPPSARRGALPIGAARTKASDGAEVNGFQGRGRPATEPRAGLHPFALRRISAPPDRDQYALLITNWRAS